jgi:hypothetical protein
MIRSINCFLSPLKFLAASAGEGPGRILLAATRSSCKKISGEGGQEIKRIDRKSDMYLQCGQTTGKHSLTNECDWYIQVQSIDCSPFSYYELVSKEEDAGREGCSPVPFCPATSRMLSRTYVLPSSSFLPKIRAEISIK